MNIKPKDHYIIFSGVFTTPSGAKKGWDTEKVLEYFNPWWERLESKAFSGLLSFADTYFYSSFIQAHFPEYKKSGTMMPEASEYLEKSLRKEELCHLSLKNEYKLNDLEFFRKTRDGEKEYSVPFEIEWADIFLFPGSTGIFAFKTRLSGDFNFKIISDFIFLLREQTIKCISQNGREIDTAELIGDYLLYEDEIRAFKGSYSDNGFNSKLKTYSIIEADIPVETESEKEAAANLLYEIGTVSPIGSTTVETDYSPARSYLESVMDQNAFSVFKNWQALSLFDSFTVIFNKVQPHNVGCAFNNFENLYFPIYIQNLFLKYLCFNMNNRISATDLRGRLTARLRNEFLNIKNKYLFSHISYNFLPNSLNEHIRSSLDLDSELEQLEDKIESINAYILEKDGKRTNIILGLFSVLSIGSTFFDTSEWFQKLFSIPAESYQIMSLSLVSTTAILCMWIFVLLSRKH